MGVNLGVWFFILLKLYFLKLWVIFVKYNRKWDYGGENVIGDEGRDIRSLFFLVGLIIILLNN